MWAILYGHRSFAALIGSDEPAAASILQSIKVELEVNDKLLEDFPKACYPIRRLEGIANRCKGQLCNGKATYVSWKADMVSFPFIDGSKSSGSVIKVTGITGGIRGMKVKLPDGTAVRPDIALIDDPQTRQSAYSDTQCDSRARTIAGDVLKLAGPDKTIAALMPCTVIRKGDMADLMLDRSKFPQWQGERMKMVYEWPERMDLWDEYGNLRRDQLSNEGSDVRANDFYAANRAEMDAGAKLAWSERHHAGELSALQHAMNVRFADEENAEAAFFSEYQNEPMADNRDIDELDAVQIASKVNLLLRGRVPLDAVRLTAFIDVQAALLYYVVCAWADNFTGAVIDYGTWPQQRRDYFALHSARPTLADATGVDGLEAQLYAGFEALCGDLLSREWKREDDEPMRIEKCGIDANWGTSTPVVKQFCRRSTNAALLMPCHGKYVGARSNPLTSRGKKPGERFGLNWIVPLARQGGRHVLYDTNFWKSFMHGRLAVPLAAPGCLSLFGDKPSKHRLFADHLTAEYRTAVSRVAGDRVVDEWSQKPTRPDNHWLDCLVGNCVLASMQGCSLDRVHNQERRRQRQRVSYAEMQGERR